MPHIHELYDFTVSGVIVHGDKTLLIKHKKLSIWTPPAGHVELHQTPIDALYAEILEEAGINHIHLTLISTNPDELAPGILLDSERLPVPFEINVHDISDTHRHIDMGYILISDTNKVTPREDESQEWKWFTLEELRAFAEIPENIRARHIYALTHVAKYIKTPR